MKKDEKGTQLFLLIQLLTDVSMPTAGAASMSRRGASPRQYHRFSADCPELSGSQEVW
jgi:hypothetical protein